MSQQSSNQNSNQALGMVCGILGAVCYGTNPLGALRLFDEGLMPGTVIFYRFAFAALMLAVVMLVRGMSFRLTRHETLVLAGLGLLMSSSSLTLYLSFRFMAASVASTMLFVYPIMVAVIMAVLYHERVTFSTVFALVLALGGLALLYDGGEVRLSTVGVVLVLISALTWAFYLVLLNKSHVRLSSMKLTFYCLSMGSVPALLFALFFPSEHFMLLPSTHALFWALFLALVPTVLALVFTTIAVNRIGSTPTAIMGALEPLTAVIIGVSVFSEPLTSRLVIGIVLILSAVTLIVLGKSMSPHAITKFIGRLGHVVVKRWRWR